MRKQTGFAQHLFAHRFQILQRGFISKTPQRVAHLGKQQFWLVSQTEQGLGASHAFSGAHHFHHFVRRHGVRAELACVAPKCAIAAVVSTQIRQGKKYLARIGNDSGLELHAGELRGCEQRWKDVVVRKQQTTRGFTRDRICAVVGQLSNGCGHSVWGGGGHCLFCFYLETRFLRILPKPIPC